MKTCPTCSASYGNDVGFCPRDGSALRSSAGLEPGAVIRKKYEILSEIGRGGMGVVYRARHLIWNEEKALKVLVAEGAAVQHGLKSLMAEALVMRHLEHPNIVRVEDADYTEDDQAFIVMEYVEGQSLRQKLDRGPLGPELALQIAAQTCSALSVAHQKGIVHRDIKPQNLLLAKGVNDIDTVKIIDFGIAKVREATGLGFTGMVTSTGLFVGTPEYASPEQARGMRGGELDGRTDLYSLGLVLYEMLTGRLPFGADTPFAVLVQRIQVAPISLDQIRPGLSFSPLVSSLVMKALEKDREERFQSAAEMERAIIAVLEIWQTARTRQERDRADSTRLATETEQAQQTIRPEAELVGTEQRERETVTLTNPPGCRFCTCTSPAVSFVLELAGAVSGGRKRPIAFRSIVTDGMRRPSAGPLCQEPLRTALRTDIGRRTGTTAGRFLGQRATKGNSRGNPVRLSPSRQTIHPEQRTPPKCGATAAAILGKRLLGHQTLVDHLLHYR